MEKSFSVDDLIFGEMIICRKSEEESMPYCFKLDRIKEYLKEEFTPRDTIDEVLGTLCYCALNTLCSTLYNCRNI